MKIAVVIDTWFPAVGGGQINVWEISKRIAAKNIQIDVITRDNGKDNPKKLKNLKIYKLGSRSDPNNYISKMLFIPKALLFVMKGDYDLIHAHAFLPGLLAPIIKIFKKPFIFTVHGTSLGTNLNNWLKNWLERLILTKIPYDGQITVSRDFLNYKNVNKRIYYIANGVNIKDFDKVKTNKFKTPTIIFVGRLHPQKNLINLIKGFGIAKEIINNLELILVGEGPEIIKIKNLINNLKLNKSIKLAGKLSGRRLVELYKSSHLFILPSIYEGQPLTLLEAWSAKLPVLVSKTGDCENLVKNGQNGYLIYDVNNNREIAKKIKTAFLNKNLTKLGEDGYSFVEKNFSWQNTAKKTLHLYKDLVNGH